MSQTAVQVVIELQQSPSAEVGEERVESSPAILSKTKSSAIIITIACVSFLNTLGSGLLTVALPQIAKDLDLPHELLLW